MTKKKFLSEFERLLNFPSDAYFRKGSSIYVKGHDQPAICDRHVAGEILDVVADALNWRVKKLALTNLIKKFAAEGQKRT